MIKSRTSNATSATILVPKKVPWRGMFLLFMINSRTFNVASEAHLFSSMETWTCVLLLFMTRSRTLNVTSATMHVLVKVAMCQEQDQEPYVGQGELGATRGHQKRKELMSKVWNNIKVRRSKKVLVFSTCLAFFYKNEQIRVLSAHVDCFSWVPKLEIQVKWYL